MSEKVVPMIHVPDVKATVEWYESIGFTVLAAYGDDGEGLSFAMLSFGSGEVMFSSGGQPSTSRRREVDLYVYTDDVDALHQRLKDRVEVVEGLHDAFYGMREFIIRDLNRFWITFGQPSVFEVLMTAVQEGNAESIRRVLERKGIKPETLNSALAAALRKNNSADSSGPEIQELLKQAGAVPPLEVDLETLQTYVGKYQGEHGIEFNVTLENGKLAAAPGSQQPMSLMAVDQTTFRPIAFDNYGDVTFKVEGGKTTGCVLRLDEGLMQLKRVED